MTRNTIFRLLLLSAIVAGYWWHATVWTPLVASEAIVRVHFLSVGQGDAIVIETPNKRQVLVDAGRDTAAVAALAEVLPAGDRHIDVMIMTHPDADHIGGFAAVLDRYDTAFMISSFLPGKTAVYRAVMDHVEEGDREVRPIDRAYRFTLDGVTFFLLWPLDTVATDPNAASVALLAEYGDRRVLLTGDAPQSVESVLLTVFPDLLTDVDIVKAGHHGSRTSLSQALLDHTKPQAIVFSYGEGNPYNHPHHETLNRVATYQKKAPHARAYRTVNGTVSFCLTKETLSHC